MTVFPQECVGQLASFSLGQPDTFLAAQEVSAAAFHSAAEIYTRDASAPHSLKAGVAVDVKVSQTPLVKSIWRTTNEIY
jgi:hypothetical protein